MATLAAAGSSYDTLKLNMSGEMLGHGRFGKVIFKVPLVNSHCDTRP